MQAKSISNKVVESNDQRCVVALETCPFGNDHGSSLVTFADPIPTYACRHPDCRGRNIHDVAEFAGVDFFPDVFPGVTGEELCEGDYTIDWLIENTLVAGEMAIIGGGFKCLKTSKLIDMAVSLVSGAPFLGKLKVLKKCRVLFLSGESGLSILQSTVHRVLRSKGLKPEDVKNLTIVPDLPKLSDPTSCLKLARSIGKYRADVVIVDPLYLCLGGKNHGDIFDQGPLLASVRDLCRSLNVTPLFAHHVTKQASKSRTPPQLSDLSQAGFAEFAAQWLLLGRREEYRPDQPHHLWLSVGGRAGHSALYQLEVDEGSIHDPGGRKWDVTIGNGFAALEADRLDKWCATVLRNLKDGELSTSRAAKGCGDKVNQQAVLDHLVSKKRITCEERVERKKTIHYYRAA